MNSLLAQNVINQLKLLSVTDVIVCPGGRNIPLVFQLEDEKKFQRYYWFEERSAGFFALGRSRITNQPVAVLTTSGTAAAELLPAVMEAYYSCVPLLLITSDRPKMMRGTGAPQTADQTGLFHKHITYEQDIEKHEVPSLLEWALKGPAHLNVCFEEPLL